MDAIRKELLETIAKSRSRTKANPFRENVVKFATSAEPVASSPNNDQNDCRNNANAGAVEAESIQLRSELVSTFLDFVSKKVSEISTVHSSTTHHKRGFSSTESIPSTSDPHSHNNEAIDTATKVAIAFRQGTSTPLHARPLPMYIAADVQAVTQSWRKSVRKKPVTSSSRSHASESDYWAALDCLSSSNLLSVEIQTQNFPKVIGDCLAMVGVHRLNKEVVSVAAMKELQRQILPFDFSSSSRFSADASDCYSNSPSTFSGQNVLAQGNSNDRTGQTADDEAHVVENIDDSDSSDSVQPRTVPPVAEHQPILTARRPMLQAPSQRNGSEAVQSSNPSQQLNMNHVRAHAKQMLARHRRGMERRAGDQQIKRVPLSRYFERLRHAVPQGTTSSPETRDLNTAKDYAALLYDSLPIPAQQRNSVFAERFGFQRPTTSANRVCAINERDENQHDNRAEADAFDSGSPMEHYDSTTELVDYRLLTDTDLQGCFDDDEMAVNNRVEQELHRVEARRQQSKKFDYQPVALYRDTESAQKQKTTLNQLLMLLRKISSQRKFTDTWWSDPETMSFLSAYIRRWASARKLSVSNAKIFAALTYFSHEQHGGKTLSETQ